MSSNFDKDRLLNEVAQMIAVFNTQERAIQILQTMEKWSLELTIWHLSGINLTGNNKFLDQKRASIRQLVASGEKNQKSSFQF